MDKWGWDKDKQHTWYNQWDYKVPRSYRERYGIDYTKNNLEEKETFGQNLFIVVVCALVIGYGVLLWMA